MLVELKLDTADPLVALNRLAIGLPIKAAARDCPKGLSDFDFILVLPFLIHLLHLHFNKYRATMSKSGPKHVLC